MLLTEGNQLQCTCLEMRAFRFRPLAVFSAIGVQRFYGGQGGARPPQPPGGRSPRGGGAPPSNRGIPNEPQIIARLLEHFPADRAVVPINKWATALPDELQEALVPYGGLSAFTRSQVNFFLVRQENGITVASLSPMGQELSRQHESKEKREQKRAEKAKLQRAKFESRSRNSGPYIPPSQRKPE